MTEISNDNDVAKAALQGPDAHGQAAMLLIESLIHGLIAKSLISVADAVEIVEVAADVKRDIAADLGEPLPTLQRSLNLLDAIRLSLANDI